MREHPVSSNTQAAPYSSALGRVDTSRMFHSVTCTPTPVATSDTYGPLTRMKVPMLDPIPNSPLLIENGDMSRAEAL